jgi:hypothetical protein
MPVTGPPHAFQVSCAMCGDVSVSLQLGSAKPFVLALSQTRFGLPDFAGGGISGAVLTKARGVAAVPSQFGDTTEQIVRIAVP